MTKPEWVAHGISAYDDNGAAELNTVYHIAHLGDSLRIIEDRKVQASLVADESVLRNTRIRVSWLSANTWYGSFYGNVRFWFDWEDIVAGKNLYWVEAITHYNPTEYRILVTNRESKRLMRYKPVAPAPVIFDRDQQKWYWNLRKTSAFMIEADLSLDECRRVDFVNHHESICRRSPGKCEMMRAKGKNVGARLLALRAADMPKKRALMLFSEGRPRALNASASDSWQLIMDSLKTTRRGPMKMKDDVSRDIARAILRSYGRGHRQALQRLCNLFQSTEELRATIEAVAASAFRLASSGLHQED
jgi:hypothetical protein